MAFTPSNSDAMKKVASLTVSSAIEINPKNISKGSLILNRAVAMINANRALDGFGANALTTETQPKAHHVAFEPSTNTGGNKHDFEHQSTSIATSGDATLSSDASLTSEEKEILYCQLEECLNKLQAQVSV